MLRECRIASACSNAFILALGRWWTVAEPELTVDVLGRTDKTAMLSEEVYLRQFGQSKLAAMGQEQLEQALARAKQRVLEFEEYEKELRRSEVRFD